MAQRIFLTRYRFQGPQIVLGHPLLFAVLPLGLFLALYTYPPDVTF
jgi:hypothetical protein